MFVGGDFAGDKKKISYYNEEKDVGLEAQIMKEISSLQALTGQEFEKLCGNLLIRMGFEVEYTATTGDGGIDILAYNKKPLLSGKYIIQCKRYAGKVSEPMVRDLFGVVSAKQAVKGILITTGEFTKQALEFASGIPIELIDGKQLLDLLEENSIEIEAEAAHIGQNNKVGAILSKLSRYGESVEKEYYQLFENIRAKKGDISTIGRLAYYLFEHAVEMTYGCVDGISVLDRIVLLEEIRDLLLPFEHRFPSKEKNQNDALKLCVVLLILAQTSFLLGEYERVKRIYSNLLEWKELAQSNEKINGLLDMLWNVAFDMVCFYSGIGEKVVANYWLEHPMLREVYSIKRAMLLMEYKGGEKKDIFTEEGYELFYQTILAHLDNVIVDPCFHPVEITDTSFWESEMLYDPILEQYRYPWEIICLRKLNGEYRIKNNKGRASVWFEYYNTANGSNECELLI